MTQTSPSVSPPSFTDSVSLWPSGESRGTAFQVTGSATVPISRFARSTHTTRDPLATGTR